MCNSIPTWIVTTFGIFAVAGIFLLMNVMQQAQIDRVSYRNDPAWLRDVRRIAFILAVNALVFAVIDYLSPLSTLLLVGSAILLLSINTMSLHFRAPPSDGTRRSIANSRFGAKNTL